MLSKPNERSSAGRLSPGRSVVPSRSRTVLLYSARFKRCRVPRPGTTPPGAAGKVLPSPPRLPPAAWLGLPPWLPAILLSQPRTPRQAKMTPDNRAWAGK